MYHHHLKGKQNGVMDGPAVRVFVQGENAYRTATDWPPLEATPATFFPDGAHSGSVKSLNNGLLVEASPTATQASTLNVDGGAHML